MEAAQEAGYRIELHYVAVDSPDLALIRIRNRVALGGQDVPEPDVRRRFARSQANLPSAIALADAARLYDNTDHDRPHREVAVLAGPAWWTMVDGGAPSELGGRGYRARVAAAPVKPARDFRESPANSTASPREIFRKIRRLQRIRSR